MDKIKKYIQNHKIGFTFGFLIIIIITLSYFISKCKNDIIIGNDIIHLPPKSINGSGLIFNIPNNPDLVNKGYISLFIYIPIPNPNNIPIDLPNGTIIKTDTDLHHEDMKENIIVGKFDKLPKIYEYQVYVLNRTVFYTPRPYYIIINEHKYNEIIEFNCFIRKDTLYVLPNSVAVNADLSEKDRTTNKNLYKVSTNKGEFTLTEKTDKFDNYYKFDKQEFIDDTYINSYLIIFPVDTTEKITEKTTEKITPVEKTTEKTPKTPTVDPQVVITTQKTPKTPKTPTVDPPCKIS